MTSSPRATSTRDADVAPDTTKNDLVLRLVDNEGVRSATRAREHLQAAQDAGLRRALVSPRPQRRGRCSTSPASRRPSRCTSTATSRTKLNLRGSPRRTRSSRLDGCGVRPEQASASSNTPRWRRRRAHRNSAGRSASTGSASARRCSSTASMSLPGRPLRAPFELLRRALVSYPGRPRPRPPGRRSPSSRSPTTTSGCAVTSTRPG